MGYNDIEQYRWTLLLWNGDSFGETEMKSNSKIVYLPHSQTIKFKVSLVSGGKQKTEEKERKSGG